MRERMREAKKKGDLLLALEDTWFDNAQTEDTFHFLSL